MIFKTKFDLLYYFISELPVFLILITRFHYKLMYISHYSLSSVRTGTLSFYFVTLCLAALGSIQYLNR